MYRPLTLLSQSKCCALQLNGLVTREFSFTHNGMTARRKWFSGYIICCLKLMPSCITTARGLMSQRSIERSFSKSFGHLAHTAALIFTRLCQDVLHSCRIALTMLRNS